MKKIDIREEIYLISFHDYTKKKMLLFKKISTACPTQYDIYDSWECEKPKYYGRLRHGYFYVAKEPLGEPIYEFRFKKELGSFMDSIQEIKHLKEACKKIWKK